jgi:hypothetical protein
VRRYSHILSPRLVPNFLPRIISNTTFPLQFFESFLLSLFIWLIETESLELEYFAGDDIPDYAILSHTWEDGEVTFQAWQDFRKASKKTGFAKVKSACAQTRADGLDYGGSY